jgi:hypothetical protein
MQSIHVDGIKVQGDVIAGSFVPVEAPGVKLPMRMGLIADLPSVAPYSPAVAGAIILTDRLHTKLAVRSLLVRSSSLGFPAAGSMPARLTTVTTRSATFGDMDCTS